MNAVPDAKMAFCTRLRYSFVKIHIHHVNDLLLDIMKILWDFVKKKNPKKNLQELYFLKGKVLYGSLGKFFPSFQEFMFE